MNAKAAFSGIYPAIVSPVSENGEVMETELRALVRRFADCPVQGLYVGGGTGEGILLPVETRMRAAEIVIDESRKAVRERPLKVIVHVGSAEYLNTCRLIDHAAGLGADALSSIPPLYFSYSRESIIRFYTKLAERTDIPFIIYASAQAGTPFTADMLGELSCLPSICGIKFTGYNFFELMRMRDVVPDDFTILNGGDEVLQFGFLAGADGGVGAIYNLMPTQFCELFEAWNAGNIALAGELQKQVNAVIEVIIRFPVIAAVKVMLGFLGYPVGETVFPNNPMDEQDCRALLDQLEALEIPGTGGVSPGWRDICR